MRKEIGFTCHCKSYPGLCRGDESWGLGLWAPSVFSGKSEEAGQGWVGGLLLGTRRGCPDPWRGLGSGPSSVPLGLSWDMDLGAALASGMSGPSGLLCAFEAEPRQLPFSVG